MRVPDPEFYDIALKEFNLLDRISGHPNIINVHDIFYNRIREKIFMLMEYCGKGSDLHAFIKKVKENDENETVLNEDLIKKIMKNLLEGIRYLHE